MSTDPADWPNQDPVVVIDNHRENQVAVVIGAYHEGFGFQDLVDYGPDVTIRPNFIEALEIITVGPSGSRQVGFDHGPGTYFVVCMPDRNTMTPIGELMVVATDRGTG